MSYQTYNPYLLNIVPLFNVADPTNGGLSDVNASIGALQGMIDTGTNTIYTTSIHPFPGGGDTVSVNGNLAVSGGLTVGGIPVGADAGGSNFIYGTTTITIDSGATGIVLSNTTSSNSQAIQFITGSNSVLEIDGIGRVLYQGDGVSSNINRLWISSAIMHADRGAIGLGGSSNMSTSFDVWSGDAYFNHNVHIASNAYCLQLFQFSDSRLKRNIQELPNALSTICALHGVRYTMSGQPHVGFLAQEVKEVIPEAVTQTQEGVMAVDYTRIVPILVEAVKELAAKLRE
jgi:hypothetical protein